MRPGPAASVDATDQGELAGILFDMDGTLVDSERLWTVALQRVATELGGELSASTRAAMVGQSIPTSIELLLADLGVNVDPAATMSLLLELTGEIFAEELLWQPGAEELLDAAQAGGLRLALVTNSPRSLVDVAMDLLGPDRFDATVCGDEVQHTKPDPEPYRRAMELIGLSPSSCLAVEDSPSGTEAAVAAGIPVLVVPSEAVVPEGAGRIFTESLLGATIDELRHIHREFQRQRQPAAAGRQSAGA